MAERKPHEDDPRVELEIRLSEVRDFLFAVTKLLEPRDLDHRAHESAIQIAYKAYDAAEEAIEAFNQLPREKPKDEAAPRRLISQ